MFASSHRVQIKEESSDEEEASYAFRRQKQQISRRRPQMYKHAISYELFELSDKLTGTMHDFKMYNESDLPFLDPRNL